MPIGVRANDKVDLFVLALVVLVVELIVFLGLGQSYAEDIFDFGFSIVCRSATEDTEVTENSLFFFVSDLPLVLDFLPACGGRVSDFRFGFEDEEECLIPRSVAVTPALSRFGR